MCEYGNRCSVSFNVNTSLTDQNRFFGALKPIVTCGGNSGGTDMSQFPIANLEAGGFFGYHKYCLKNRPLCNCKTGIPQAACCIHNVVNASVAAYPHMLLLQRMHHLCKRMLASASASEARR